MFWMIRVYFCSVFVVEVFSLRALTWDHCHCSWEAWRAWSECSETCGGGIQNRSRRVWHDDNNECYNFEKCASIDEGLETRPCNTTCFNGLFNLNNISLNGSCDCANGTTGACCTAVTCGPPSSIKHGSFTGDDFTFNHHVLYKCDKDYSMTHPTEANRTCTEHGQWSGNTPVCIYERSCDSNTCKNGATCLNILGDYHCICLPEWTGKQCQVAVTCGPPSSIKHGSFTGDDFTYNHHVLYKCDKDYNMTHPTEANRTCTEHGQWSGNTPVCIYERSCDSNTCKNGATCLNILGDYHCTCRPEWTGKQCQVEILPSGAGNRTTRLPRGKGEFPPQKGKAGTTAEIVNIAVGVSVSIALLGLTVLGFFLVRTHLNKSARVSTRSAPPPDFRINTRDYIDTELQTVSSVVTVQNKHDGFECRPI